MRLYFIRHGQSSNNALWDATGSELGRSEDPELTQFGHQQAKLLATHLRQAPDAPDKTGFGITHLYASPMVRAIQTALPVADELGLGLEIWEDWHEIGGIHQLNANGESMGRPGKDRAHFQEQFPSVKLPDNWALQGWWHERPREDRAACFTRAQRAWQGLLERHGDNQDRVAIVSHGFFFMALMGVVLELPNFEQAMFFAHNTSISAIHVGEHSARIVVAYSNHVPHLPPELIS